MSLRDNIIAVKSIADLRSAIASNDTALHANLAKAYDDILRDEFGDPSDLDEDDAEEFNERREAIAAALNDIILCDEPPTVEAGEWWYVYDLIVDELKLRVRCDVPLETYKHLHTWNPYRQRIGNQISDDVDRLLSYLEEGRPLIGKSMESDWAMFAWLDNGEIALLYDALANVSYGADDGTGLLDFHSDLVESLKRLRKNKCDMLLVAD